MKFRHRGLSHADVFLASYPRSGNTWLKSLITSSLFGEAMTNFSDTVNPVIPIVGFHRGVQPVLSDSGRIIKTHERFRPEYKRAIWIVRDPRDVVVSEYKLELRSNRFSGSFETFLKGFISERLNGTANWQNHTLSWADCPLVGTTDLLTIRFEDLRSNTAAQLKCVLDYLGVDSSDTVVQQALTQNTLHSMAVRHAEYDQTLAKTIQADMPAVNNGQSGGWRETLSKDAIRVIEDAFGEAMSRMSYSVLR